MAEGLPYSDAGSKDEPTLVVPDTITPNRGPDTFQGSAPPCFNVGGSKLAVTSGVSDSNVPRPFKDFIESVKSY